MLRIKKPLNPGFLEIAEECEGNGTFDVAFNRILDLMRVAAKERNTHQTHLLSVSLHAFLLYKGGNYATRSDSTVARGQEAQAKDEKEGLHSSIELNLEKEWGGHS